VEKSKLTRADKERIVGLNAAKLLGLKKKTTYVAERSVR
jgi:hypothetical protein